MTNGQPKLLCPAGSLAALAAALSGGADAAYVGVRGWSRGGPMAGLSAEEIPEAAAACRRAGSDLQVALNTVPGSAEVAEYMALLRRLRDDGAGTVILNDPGMIAVVRREFPALSICASVGVSALNPEEARFYRELGADAIVLPTAVSPDEVPTIKAAGGIRVEVFVHCRAEFILQGKCGLSGYAHAGRPSPERPDLAAAGPASSAKRGGHCFLACAALPVPRAAYSIEDELPLWVAAGVDAFKVQGRELPPDKLFALVARLRRKLDAALSAA